MQRKVTPKSSTGDFQIFFRRRRYFCKEICKRLRTPDNCRNFVSKNPVDEVNQEAINTVIPRGESPIKLMIRYWP